MQKASESDPTTARASETSAVGRAEIELRASRAALGALAEAVLVFGANGRLQLSNNAADQMFDGRVPSSESDLLARVLVDAAEVESEEPGARDLQINGTDRWIELSRYDAAGPDDEANRGSALTVVVLRDVTATRATRAARDAFLGVLSHELRTPITTIYGGSELLERGLSDERREEVMSDIRVESERLARLVEDLLVMTRIERGTIENTDEPILVQRLLPSVIHAFSGQWPDVNVDLRISERLSAVRGDPTYVEQVVRNLLTNAVRYGRAAEQGVEVVADEGEGEVWIRVLDRGQGLAEGEAERLFELFYRSDAARAVPGGAGIGLFVCRHLIEAMGGNLWATNRPGGGAEFGFTLPVVDSEL